MKILHKPNLVSNKILHLVKEDNYTCSNKILYYFKNYYIYVVIILIIIIALCYRYKIIREDKKENEKILQQYILYKKKKKLKKKLKKLKEQEMGRVIPQNTHIENDNKENIQAFNSYSNFVSF